MLPVLLLLGGGALLAWWASQEARAVEQLARSSRASSRAPSSSSATSPAAARWYALGGLEVRVSGLEQTLGGVDTAYIRNRLAPKLAQLARDLGAAHLDWPGTTGAPRVRVTFTDRGFHVAVGWPLARAPRLAREPDWRRFVEDRLRQSEDHERLSGFTFRIARNAA